MTKKHQLSTSSDDQHIAKGVPNSVAINQRIGRRQITNLIQKVVTVTDLHDLLLIKKNKIYAGFEIEADDKKVVIVRTWEEYCHLVEGKSVESIDLDLKNFSEFGADCFESLRKIGVGPSLMRSLRKLPDDEKTAAIELANAGDKGALAEFVGEMVNKHNKEKLSLKESLNAEKKSAADERSAYKYLQANKTKLEEQLNEAQTQLKQAYSPATGLHPKTIATREEAAVMQFESISAIDELQKLFDALNKVAITEDDEKAQKEHSLQMGTVLLQARTMHARSTVLINHIRDNGYEIPHSAKPEDHFTADEVAWYLQEISEVINVREHKKSGRANLRDYPVTEPYTKRGRKPKNQ